MYLTQVINKSAMSFPFFYPFVLIIVSSLFCLNKNLLPVPIIYGLFGASELISQAHSNHIGDSIEKGSHPSQARDPYIRVEVLVTEETIPVKITAAPTGLAYVIVKYDHYIVFPKARHHRLVSF
ncbi:hypothetical protein SCA6_007574 [Theobroma cacao]